LSLPDDPARLLGPVPSESEDGLATAAAHAGTVRQYLTELQFPPPVPWFFATTGGEVAPRCETVAFLLMGQLPPFPHAPRDPISWTATWTVPSPELAACWAGHRIELFGVTCALRMYDGHEPGLDYGDAEALTLGALQGPFWRIRNDATDQRIDAQIWRQRAYPTARPDCFAELRWWRGLGAAPQPLMGGTGIELPGPEGDAARAVALHALAALRRRPTDTRGTLRSTRGRKRLEENPTHPWRWYAEQADAMLAKEPWRRLEYIVGALKVPGPNVDAKVRKLEGWRQRLHEQQSA
jgi:hypothetical protein